MKKPTGCPRHLFTAVAAEDGRDGGFRTVAHSPELSGLVAAIEGLVDGYRAADPGSPVCRQLLPVPGRSQIYAFTVFTPTGPTPEGRAGNYWAETLIVPADWLADAGWDTAAAFDRLEWRGPQDAAELGDDLAAVVLPPPRPGPLDRLEKLIDAVPESYLFSLLSAVVRQSRGLRKIRLVEAPGTGPEALDAVVSLLPLLVPPDLRTYRDGDKRRCLSWRTRSPRGGMAPAADLTGFPASAADDLEREGEGSSVFDLAGGLPAPAPGDRFGERYARWLHQTLTRGRWGDLEALYAGEISEPAAAWLAGFRGPDSAHDPPPDGAGGEAPIFGARQAAWQARDAAEGRAWALLESHRRQLEASLSELRRELDEETRKVSQQWRKALERHRDAVEVRGGELAAEAAHSAGRGLEARVASLEKEIRRLRAGPGAAEDPGSAEPRRERFAQQAESLAARWKRRLQQRDAASLIPKVAIVALLVAAVVWGATSAVRSFSERRAAVEIPADALTRTSEALREQRRESLLQRLRDRETAIFLLRQAAADEDYRRRADAVLLALTLGQRAGLLDEAGKALLQEALEVTVDGQWGPGSSQSLADNLPTVCEPCATPGADGFLTWDGGAASCFLIVYLSLEDPPCPGSSPWREGRVWTEAEAANALALVRAAAASATDPETSARIAGLDPDRAQELWSAVPDPTLQQAEMLFDLAFALVAGEPRASAPERPSTRRLNQIGALLDRLAADGTGAEPSPEAGGGG